MTTPLQFADYKGFDSNRASSDELENMLIREVFPHRDFFLNDLK